MVDPVIAAEVKGLKEVQKKMEQIVKDITGTPVVEGIRKATLVVYRSAKKNADRRLPQGPAVDTGRLRASITPQVVAEARTVKGIVGSNVVYAPFQELGTRRFWPPWEPIFQWARRKLKGNVRRARALTVAVRGTIAAKGIKAKRFLQDALEDNAEKIFKILGTVVSRIVEK